MKSIIDRPTIQRRARLAHTASLGGIIILLGSVVYSLFQPQQGWVTVGMILLGFVVSAIGVFMANRWVKKPRPEDVLDKSLKSFSDQYRLYHYGKPCDHLLLTPTGLVILEVINQDGLFIYENQRWKQKMTLSRAFRYIFEERMGNPFARVQSDIKALEHMLTQVIPETATIPIKGVVIFVHPAAVLQVKHPPIPVLQPKNLHKHLPTSNARLSTEIYCEVQEILDRVYHAV